MVGHAGRRVGPFKKRRMGVALATGKNPDEARERAKLAASKIIPVKV